MVGAFKKNETFGEHLIFQNTSPFFFIFPCDRYVVGITKKNYNFIFFVGVLCKVLVERGIRKISAHKLKIQYGQ
jgi:hypothetical protein